MTLDEKQNLAYRSLDNYKILNCGENKKAVAVYFTSHNLFYPDTLESFNHSIYDKDYYEWIKMGG